MLKVMQKSCSPNFPKPELKLKDGYIGTTFGVFWYAVECQSVSLHIQTEDQWILNLQGKGIRREARWTSIFQSAGECYYLGLYRHCFVLFWRTLEKLAYVQLCFVQMFCFDFQVVFFVIMFSYRYRETTHLDHRAEMNMIVHMPIIRSQANFPCSPLHMQLAVLVYSIWRRFALKERNRPRDGHSGLKKLQSRLTAAAPFLINRAYSELRAWVVTHSCCEHRANSKNSGIGVR